jgi:hypothetical protein
MIPENCCVFKIATREGSLFVARLDNLQEIEGQTIGQMTLIGYSKRIGRDIHVVGRSYVPEVGSTIVVDAYPVEVLQIEGEAVNVFPKEFIVRVDELQVDLKERD